MSIDILVLVHDIPVPRQWGQTKYGDVCLGRANRGALQPTLTDVDASCTPHIPELLSIRLLALHFNAHIPNDEQCTVQVGDSLCGGRDDL